MDKPTIGIRIANGTYFPIMNENEAVRKKVVLSPVRDNQKDVKIDLFRGEGDGMHNPSYVASLILNNISQNGGTQKEIVLLVSVNSSRILDAEAYEPVSDNRQFLSISLDAIDQDSDFFEMPDEQYSDEPFLSASLEDEDSLQDNSEEFGADNYTEEEAAYLYSSEKDKDRKTFLLKAAVIVLSIIFIILAGLLVYTLLMKPALARKSAEAAPAAAVVQEAAPAPQPSVPPPPREAALPAAPPPAAVQPETPAPVPPPPAAAPPPAADIRYRIKWGDTLWDISKAYYRTPWLYGKIAGDNNIQNPDLIYAGTYLTIKPQ